MQRKKCLRMIDANRSLEVAIVVAVHNGEKFVKEAIESALDQMTDRRPNSLVVIVVDDGSTDNTQSILRSFGTKILNIYQKRAGACSARNAGIMRARALGAHYVKFLDADDLLEPGSIDSQLRETRKLSSSDRVAIYQDAIWVDHQGELNASIKQPTLTPPPTPYDHSSHVCWMTANAPLTSSPLHRLDDLIKVDGFDTRVRRGQENDLHLRLAIDGVRFQRIQGFSYRYRQHGINRISHRNPADFADNIVDTILRHELLISDKFGIRGERAILELSRRLWRFGREAARKGDRQAAQLFFDTAKQLVSENPIVGHPIYRLVSKAIGPFNAEQLLSRQR